MKTLTVVEDGGNLGPRTWNQAADICVNQIFDFADSMVKADWGPNRSPDANNAYSAISSRLGLLEDHFNGMVSTWQLVEIENMYWVTEWQLLGAVAAFPGIVNNHFSEIFGFPGLELDLADGPTDQWFDANSGLQLNLDTVNISTRSRVAITALLCRKQRDYGRDAIERFGRDGLIVRVHDKIARLKNLMKIEATPNNESISDTYVDLVGYAAIGMMVERNWFSLPLVD